MGDTKVETQTETIPKATAQESELNKLQLEQFKQTVGPQTDVQLSGLDLLKKLLQGGEGLPGIFGELGAGISPEAIGTQATQLATEALPQFQLSGILDSGLVGKEISKSIASQLLFPAEQFNIGAKQNLLNLALSGQAQVQQPVAAGTGLLSGRLAGLRSTSGSQTVTRNPFLESFFSSAGKTLGSPSFGAGPFSFGG